MDPQQMVESEPESEEEEEEVYSLDTPQMVGIFFARPYYSFVTTLSPSRVYELYYEAEKSVVGRPDARGVMLSGTTLDSIEKLIGLQGSTNHRVGRVDSIDAQWSVDGILVLVTGRAYSKEELRRTKFAQAFIIVQEVCGYLVLNDIFRVLSNHTPEAAVPPNPSVQQCTRLTVSKCARQEALRGRYFVGQYCSLLSSSSSESEVPKFLKFYRDKSAIGPPDSGGAVRSAATLPVFNDFTPEDVAVYAFVGQYYSILSSSSPSNVKNFYGDESVIGRPDSEGSMSIVTTLPEPKLSLVYTVVSADAQQSDNGVMVLVTGFISGNDEFRKFTQVFFLVPIEGSYFVLNDMFMPLDGEEDDATTTPDTVKEHAIFVVNLPMEATSAQLVEVFEKYGPIKPNGVQVRSDELHKSSFGFVEFETAEAVLSACKEHACFIGGGHVFVEAEKGGWCNGVVP